MLAPRFRLTASQRHDLVAVCEIGASRLYMVATKISSGKFTIRRSKLEELMHQEVGPEKGAMLARLVFGIAGTFRSTGSTPSEFLDRLEMTIPGGTEKDELDILSRWPECKPALQRLLETDAVLLAAKALDISYDFERVYLAGRLLTSIRPVFDVPRENIIGSTIVQTLRLEFVAPNGEQSSISVALDSDDIIQLKEECEIALDKAAKSKEKIEHDCGIEAIIPGEEQ